MMKLGISVVKSVGMDSAVTKYVNKSGTEKPRTTRCSSRVADLPTRDAVGARTRLEVIPDEQTSLVRSVGVAILRGGIGDKGK